MYVINYSLHWTNQHFKNNILYDEWYNSKSTLVQLWAALPEFYNYVQINLSIICRFVDLILLILLIFHHWEIWESAHLKEAGVMKKFTKQGTCSQKSTLKFLIRVRKLSYLLF